MNMGFEGSVSTLRVHRCSESKAPEAPKLLHYIFCIAKDNSVDRRVSKIMHKGIHQGAPQYVLEPIGPAQKSVVSLQ